MSTIDYPENISIGEYMNFLFGDGKLGLKEIRREHDHHSVGGKFLGDAVEYELRDKNGKIVDYVCVFIPTSLADPGHASSNGHATASSGAASHIGDITEIYFMNPDDGKPPQLSQMGDPDLTVMSMKNMAIDPNSFVAGMSDDDLFVRYPYAVTLFNGAVEIEGSKFNDFQLEVGEGGKAVVDGNAGADILHVWHQKTVDFDGGKGSDTLAFQQVFGGTSDPGVGATVDLGKGTAHNPWGGTIKLTSVENVVGFYGEANTLIGNNEANRLSSGGYGDVLKGLGGNDIITVESYLGQGTEVPRNLHADGGKGTDTLIYYGSADVASTLDLEHPEDNTGAFAGSTFKNFEVFRSDGFAGPLTFRGSDAAEKVFETYNPATNDVLDGRGGNDVLSGAYGADSLTGGTGADVFLYSFTPDLDPGAPDTITDFSHAEHDRINLSKIYFPKLDFIGSKDFNGHAGELHAIRQGGQILVEADIDGDKTADFAVLLDGSPKLVEGDFAL